jgi:hypothetical protein
MVPFYLSARLHMSPSLQSHLFSINSVVCYRIILVTLLPTAQTYCSADLSSLFYRWAGQKRLSNKLGDSFRLISTLEPDHVTLNRGNRCHLYSIHSLQSNGYPSQLSVFDFAQQSRKLSPHQRRHTKERYLHELPRHWNDSRVMMSSDTMQRDEVLRA